MTQYQLIDFGIAKAISNDTTNIHRLEQCGTPNFISPEALIADDNPTSNGNVRYKVGRSSDVWSLGCILYQMIYGRPPFMHRNQLVIMQRIVNPNYKIHFGPCPDHDAIDVLRRIMVRDPKKRPTIPELLRHPFLDPFSMHRTSSADQQSQPDDQNTMRVDREQLGGLLAELVQMNIKYDPDFTKQITKELEEQLEKGESHSQSLRRLMIKVANEPRYGVQ